MKTSKLLLLFIIGLSSLLAQEAIIIDKNLIKKNGFRKIEKIIEEFSSDTLSKSITEKYELYDNDANVIERCSFFEGKLSAKWVSSYDKKNNEIKRTAYNSSGIEYTFLYSYDKKDNLILEEWYDSADELTMKKKYKYDSRKRLIEESIFDGNDIATQRTQFIFVNDKNTKINIFSGDVTFFASKIINYDKKGNKTSVKEFSAENEFRSEYSYSYDRKNNLIEEKWFGLNGIVNLFKQYQYDSYNRIIKELFLNADGKTVVTKEKKYDGDGYLESESTLDNIDGIKTIIRFVYSEKKLPREEMHYGSDGKLLFKYKYIYEYHIPK